MQAAIITAYQTAQNLVRSEVDTSGLMLLKQLEEWLISKIAAGRLPLFTGLPLQMLQDPTAVIAGLNAYPQQRRPARGQLLTAQHQRVGQSSLTASRHFIFDHLGKT